MQLYQPERNLDNGQVLPIHFSKAYNIPPNIQNMLQTACYDCHSNNTSYPWYAYIQPGRMLMENHIKKGKKDLNYSEWGNYSKRKKESKLNGMIKQIKSGEMPLSSYTMIHKNAVLSESQKTELITWINTINIDE